MATSRRLKRIKTSRGIGNAFAFGRPTRVGRPVFSFAALFRRLAETFKIRPLPLNAKIIKPSLEIESIKKLEARPFLTKRSFIRRVRRGGGNARRRQLTLTSRPIPINSFGRSLIKPIPLGRPIAFGRPIVGAATNLASDSRPSIVSSGGISRPTLTKQGQLVAERQMQELKFKLLSQ